MRALNATTARVVSLVGKALETLLTEAYRTQDLNVARAAYADLTGVLERVMREMNRRTDVGVRWSVEGVRGGPHGQAGPEVPSREVVTQGGVHRPTQGEIQPCCLRPVSTLRLATEYYCLRLPPLAKTSSGADNDR